jgi:hypothetical protein
MRKRLCGCPRIFFPRARLAGLIEDVRSEIAARIEKLRDVPGLHTAEIHAIDNSHRMLQLLEVDEVPPASEDKRRAIDEALHHLRSIAGKMEKLE